MSTENRNITKVSINSVNEYIEEISNNSNFYYRGVSNIDFKLIPSIGRGRDISLEALVAIERSMLQQFKLRAVSYLNYTPENSWEWLMLGQHHGMPTRLLDWTSNPLIALYFACFDNEGSDGVVYSLQSAPPIDLSTFPDPFSIESNFMVIPKHVSPRVTAQSSYFSISHNPLLPFETTTEKTVTKYVISSKSKPSIVRFLALKLGIGPSSLFPGLDGLCEQIALEINTFKLVSSRMEALKTFAETIKKTSS